MDKIQQQNLNEKKFSLDELNSLKLLKNGKLTSEFFLKNNLLNWKNINNLKDNDPWAESYTFDEYGYLWLKTNLWLNKDVVYSDFYQDFLWKDKIEEKFPELKNFTLNNEGFYEYESNNDRTLNFVWKSYSVESWNNSQIFFVNENDKIYVFELLFVDKTYKFKQHIVESFTNDWNNYTIKFKNSSDVILDDEVDIVVKDWDLETDNNKSKKDKKNKNNKKNKNDDLPKWFIWIANSATILKDIQKLWIDISSLKNFDEKPWIEEVGKIIWTATWWTFAISNWKLLPLWNMKLNENSFILDLEGKAYLNVWWNLFFDLNKNTWVDVYYFDKKLWWLSKYEELNKIKIKDEQNIRVQVSAYNNLLNTNINKIMDDQSKPIFYSEIWWRKVSCFDILSEENIDKNGTNSIFYHLVYNTDQNLSLKINMKGKINLVYDDWKEEFKIPVVSTGRFDNYLLEKWAYYNVEMYGEWKKKLSFIKTPRWSWIVTKEIWNQNWDINKLNQYWRIFYINPEKKWKIPVFTQEEWTTFINELKNKYLIDKIYTIQLISWNVEDIKNISWLQVFKIWNTFYAGLSDNKEYIENIEKLKFIKSNQISWITIEK